MADYTSMIHRHLTEPLRQALSDTPVVLVNGARQTGKSTLVQSPELAGAGRQYLTFDDPGVLAAAQRDPNGFVSGLSSPVTLDEVQHVPELFSAIKVAVDQKREPGRFLLTGSANVLLLPKLGVPGRPDGSADALAVFARRTNRRSRRLPGRLVLGEASLACRQRWANAPR